LLKIKPDVRQGDGVPQNWWGERTHRRWHRVINAGSAGAGGGDVMCVTESKVGRGRLRRSPRHLSAEASAFQRKMQPLMVDFSSSSFAARAHCDA
jgi:hypothetical protein